ncbi:hypothetical protein GCM10008101_28010 [Lysobacter xinjiangensis]|uniref:Phage integrase family protein n=1 Tax=Cognatilysobacter xinjiangensis TaxID=546892 RepID=A0ABQ3CAH3_9GAMM|nr:hypothetical protein [Lysobacter xinjiangensis]GGZ72142.1 hypothetical protein GCM10008101_28010 [Lysobacter xinjiangensis]
MLESGGDDVRKQVANLIATLGVPPDLAYLVDGLRRTRELLTRNGRAFDELLGQGQYFWTDTTALLRAMDVVDRTVATWTLSADDPVMRAMERTPGQKEHPLRHKCLQWCPFWANLFTEPEPASNAAERSAYEVISDQVGLNILVLQARRCADDIVGHYERWALTGLQPTPESGPSASRIRQASVQIRRLSEQAYLWLTLRLAGNYPTLGARVEATARHAEEPASDDAGREEQRNGTAVLDAFRRLHEEVVGPRAPSMESPARPYRTTRRTLPFGNVRLATGHVHTATDELDDGMRLMQLYAIDGNGTDDEPAIDPSHVFAMMVTAPPGGDAGPEGAEAERYGYRRLEAKRLTRVIARSQAMPSCSAAQLVDWAVKRVRDALLDPATHGLRPPMHEVLLAMLATGRDAFESEIRIVRADEPLPDARDARGDGVWYLQGLRTWRIEVPPPAFGDDDWIDGQEIRTSPYLDLPDVLGFFRVAAETTAKSGLARAQSTEGPIFREELDEWLRGYLWNKWASVRQLRSWLPRRLLEVSNGDLALALHVTHQSTAHARSVSHYTVQRTGVVLQHYRDALRPLAEDIEMPVGQPDAHIGARRVPTLAAIVGLVSAMAQRVRAGAGVERANALTAYTMIGFHLAGAARPLALRTIQQADLEDHLMVLPEKGTRYDRRVLFIPAVVKRQLQLYGRALLSLGIRPCESTGAFVMLSQDEPDPQPFTAAELGRRMAECDFELKPYALRRFTRSYLADHGIDAEDLDAFMGHWGAFLSPHDPLSLYPTRRLRELAEGPVSQLLANVGYVALP